MADAARSCNGCGACRSQLPDVRMCPIFRNAPAEESSPRAKANLMRGVLSGQLDPATLTSDDFKEVADLCVHCHMCRLECPATVDIPKLMAEAKGSYVAVNGLGLNQWAMALVDTLCSWGQHVSRRFRIGRWAIALRAGCWRKVWHRAGTQVAALRFAHLSARGGSAALDAASAP